MHQDTILNIKGLEVRYGRNQVLHGVDLELPRGASLGIVGESGSGKSTIAWTVLGLLPPGAAVTAGSVAFDGEDITGERAAGLRGDRIAMVFQDPFTALNPSLPVGRQITEALVERGRADARSARAEALRLMDEVRLPRASTLLDAYPHQLSGGMKQRIVIATALACSPDLLLLDEPTTALDVTVEARILDLLDELRVQRGLSMVFISHNIGLVERMCSRVTVMHGGRVQEAGAAQQVLWHPAHAYTRKLLAALPLLEKRAPAVPAVGAPIARVRDVRLTFRPAHPLGGWARLLRLPRAEGALVSSVEAEGPAESAGVQPGDVILKFNGEPIKRWSDLPRIVGETKPGTSAKMDVWRKGRNVTLSVKVAELKSDRSAATADEGKQAEPTAENHLGLGVVDVPSDTQRKLRIKGGAQVRVAEGAAAQAGLQEGDIVLAVNDTDVTDAAQFNKLVSRLDKKKAAGLLVRRGDQTQWVAVQPASK